MTRLMIVMMVLACLIAAAGCVNVKVPEGPYLKVNQDSTSPSKTNVEFTQTFLRSAWEDGMITEAQYKELRRRLESCSGS